MCRWQTFSVPILVLAKPPFVEVGCPFSSSLIQVRYSYVYLLPEQIFEFQPAWLGYEIRRKISSSNYRKNTEGTVFLFVSPSI